MCLIYYKIIYTSILQNVCENHMIKSNYRHHQYWVVELTKTIYKYIYNY
jgi:hypothetical protein